jgi:hypothetical protein
MIDNRGTLIPAASAQGQGSEIAAPEKEGRTRMMPITDLAIGTNTETETEKVIERGSIERSAQACTEIDLVNAHDPAVEADE